MSLSRCKDKISPGEGFGKHIIPNWKVTCRQEAQLRAAHREWWDRKTERNWQHRGVDGPALGCWLPHFSLSEENEVQLSSWSLLPLNFLFSVTKLVLDIFPSFIPDESQNKVLSFVLMSYRKGHRGRVRTHPQSLRPRLVWPTSYRLHYRLPTPLYWGFFLFYFVFCFPNLTSKKKSGWDSSLLT